MTMDAMTCSVCLERADWCRCRGKRRTKPLIVELAEKPEDAIEMLTRLLKEAGARPTIDHRRSTALPCWRCGTTDVPRDLHQIGTYTRAVGGGILAGDAITRPLCATCEEGTRP